MIPPYTYAAGRMADERRRDAIRRDKHARLMHEARLVRPRSKDRSRTRKASAPAHRPGDAIRRHARSSGPVGRPRATRS